MISVSAAIITDCTPNIFRHQIDIAAQVLDLEEWQELGSGQKLADDWLDNVARCETYWRKSNVQLQLLRNEYNDQPTIEIRKTINIYKAWLRWWKKAPNKMMFMGAPQPEQIESMIEELEIELRKQIDAQRGRP